jgi:Na+/melibiose symporter-like transporter
MRPQIREIATVGKPTPNQPGRDADAACNGQAGAGSSDRPVPQRKLWHAGTLTYTSGGLVVLFSWLLWGDFAWSMRERAVYPVVQLLVKRFGASDSVLALLLSSLPSAMGALLSPIVSYRSDRHRGRWGRRIPYILVATPMAALFMVGLACSGLVSDLVRHALGARLPAGVNLPLIIFGVFWVSFEFSAIVAGSVHGALTNDVVPRPFLGRFYGLFRIVSLLAGIIFNYWMLGAADVHCEWLFAGIAALYGVGVMMMCLMVKEGEYPPPADARPGERKSFFAAVKVYFKECFSKPYYLWVFLAMTMGGMAAVPINLFSIPFCKSLGITMARFGKYSALTYVISLCLAYFLGALVDRFHPLRLGIFSLMLYAIATLVGFFYATTPMGFLLAIVGHSVMAGTYGTTVGSLSQRLLPHSTYAQFASAAGLLSSAVNIVLSMLFGVVLDLSGHQYRYTFLMSSGIAVAAMVLMIVVHRKFMRLGGPEHYVAPE